MVLAMHMSSLDLSRDTKCHELDFRFLFCWLLLLLDGSRRRVCSVKLISHANSNPRRLWLSIFFSNKIPTQTESISPDGHSQYGPHRKWVYSFNSSLHYRRLTPSFPPDLAKQASQLTMYDVKSYYTQAKNAVLNISEMEAKVREATNDDPWGASSTLMQQIAEG